MGRRGRLANRPALSSYPNSSIITLMEIITDNIRRLYNRRLELGKPVDDYLKRWPELKEEVKEKPKKEKPKGVRKSGSNNSP